MNARAISMEEWQRERFIHFAEAFVQTALDNMPANSREKAIRHILKNIVAKESPDRGGMET